MKIAIIGAGISGLAQYLWFCRTGLTDSHTIAIYEARHADDRRALDADQTDTYHASLIGGCIGVSPTGRKVIERLDPAIYATVLRTGHIIRSWRMSTARGWTLADIPAGGQDEWLIMIGRETLWRILEESVPSGVIVRRKVADVTLAAGQGGRPALVFADGASEEFDLVVCADGIWSVGRRAMFGGMGREEYEFSARYEGLVGVGSFVPSSIFCDVPDGEANIVNGGNGFFGYCYCSSDDGDPYKHGDTAQWWSTYSLKDLPKDWRNIDPEEVKKELQRRHLGWRNKTIQTIVANVEKGGCVLVGDAAHALTPSSGQGVSMALEDCETLALLLKYRLHGDTNFATALTQASREYSDIRRPRLDMVWRKAQEFAAMKQDMSFFEEMVMYFFIWLFTKFKFNQAYQRKLNEYDVPSAVHNQLAREQLISE